MFNIKNLVKKIKNKKLKGNISLLVILVLLATSVITLLSINQIMRLISYWNQTFNYFRAYYLAKAWNELWLAEVYNREDGFNHRIPSDNSIVSWNLLEEYSAFNPYFDTTITWSFTILTDDVRNSECSSWNKITLNSGAGIMLSLYSDTTTWTKNILSGWSTTKILNANDIKKLMLDNINNDTLTFAFFTYKLETYEDGTTDYVMDDIIVYTWNNLQQFLYKKEVSNLIEKQDNNNNIIIKKYLTIKNSWEESISFCVKMENELIPYSNSLITVIWHYGDTEVWIQSVVKKWVPDWTLNVIYKENSTS